MEAVSDSLIDRNCDDNYACCGCQSFQEAFLALCRCRPCIQGP